MEPEQEQSIKITVKTKELCNGDVDKTEENDLTDPWTLPKRRKEEIAEKGIKKE